MGLFGFGKKAEKAQEPSTFAGRVDKFWAEFSGVIDEIKADLAAEEFEKAMQKTDEKLRISRGYETPIILAKLHQKRHAKAARGQNALHARKAARAARYRRT